MRRGDALADRQAEADALGLGGEKGLEQTRLVVGRHARAVVRYGDQDLVLLFLDRDRDPAAGCPRGADRIHRVLDQVDQDLLDLDFVHEQALDGLERLEHDVYAQPFLFVFKQ